MFWSFKQPFYPLATVLLMYSAQPTLQQIDLNSFGAHEVYFLCFLDLNLLHYKTNWFVFAVKDHSLAATDPVTIETDHTSPAPSASCSVNQRCSSASLWWWNCKTAAVRPAASEFREDKVQKLKVWKTFRRSGGLWIETPWAYSSFRDPPEQLVCWSEWEGSVGTSRWRRHSD